MDKQSAKQRLQELEKEAADLREILSRPDSLLLRFRSGVLDTPSGTDPD